MAKQERQLIYNFDGSAGYWQYRQNQAEYQTRQPLKQAGQEANDSWILLMWVIGTIAILVVLAKTTIWSFF